MPSVFILLSRAVVSLIFWGLGVLGVDQQLLLEGKRLPLSDEESLPLEKNRYTCFVAPADKSSSYKAKGQGVRTEIVERLRRENRKRACPVLWASSFGFGL